MTRRRHDLEELRARLRIGACDCNSRWCRVCTPEGPASRPTAAELERLARQEAEDLEARRRELRRKAGARARAEALRLRKADPRAELRKRARELLDDDPEITNGQIAAELGLTSPEVVALLHGGNAR